jgi:ABC-type iron transport system FetAB ATPase subunit
MPTSAELVLMWQIHEHREDWKVAEQLVAIQELEASLVSLTAAELSHELGIRRLQQNGCACSRWVDRS